jgi:hypothetical protein
MKKQLIGIALILYSMILIAGALIDGDATYIFIFGLVLSFVGLLIAIIFGLKSDDNADIDTNKSTEEKSEDR